MRLSRFNHTVARPDGTTLVYHAVSGAFAVLPTRVVELLREATAAGVPIDADALGLDPDDGFLVADEAADEAAFRAWYAGYRAHTGELVAIVSTTFACNLDCTYCCQADVLSGKVMGEETAAQTAAWLAGRADASGARAAMLHFVGGEPLLQPGRIETIVGALRERLPGVPLRFALITNGVFLTPDLVARWRPLGLVSASVTLDGDETTHAITRRSRRRGEDSFATIFANVVAASELIDITVNGNYQPDTVHGFAPLLRKLAAAGLRPGSRIRFTPALTALGAPSDSASGSCTFSGSAPELMIPLADEARRVGFDPGPPVPAGPCGLHQRNVFAVDPDGHLYKCPGFLGHPEWAIGHVESGLTARYDAMLAIDPVGACGDCGHRPHCAGGCLAAEWTRRGAAEGISCERPYLDEHLPALLERGYALATSPSSAAALARFPAPPVALPGPPRRGGRRSAALAVIR